MVAPISGGVSSDPTRQDWPPLAEELGFRTAAAQRALATGELHKLGIDTAKVQRVGDARRNRREDRARVNDSLIRDRSPSGPIKNDVVRETRCHFSLGH